MTGAEAEAFTRCIGSGGVALFPSDTVYGLACSPLDAGAVARLYALKGRAPDKAAAVMFFDLDAALAALEDSLGLRTGAALGRLLPGGVTVLLANPAGRFPLACAGDPATLGVRVVRVPALAGVTLAVLQSSANRSGGPDARRLEDVDPLIRAGVDLAVDGGVLPGVASTVVDLRGYETATPGTGGWSIVRRGLVGDADVAAALEGQFHFDPASYATEIRADIPAFDELQAAVVEAAVGPAAAGERARGRVLELGTGTGETAARLLERFSGASLVGVDESPAMLAAARQRLGAAAERVTFRVARLQRPLPDGPFDLVASVLCVHHLDEHEKADLFGRIARVLGPGGRFVLGDVVVPDDPADARTSLTPGYDKPSRVADQLGWLAAAGFATRVAWTRGDLAVIVADVRR